MVVFDYPNAFSLCLITVWEEWGGEMPSGGGGNNNSQWVMGNGKWENGNGNRETLLGFIVDG